MEDLENTVRTLLVDGPQGCIQRDKRLTLHTIIGDAIASAPRVPVAPTVRSVGLRLGGVVGGALPATPSTRQFEQLREGLHTKLLWLGMSAPGLAASATLMTGFPSAHIPAHIETLEAQAEQDARMAKEATARAATTAAAVAKERARAAGATAEVCSTRDARACPMCARGKGVCDRPGTSGHLAKDEAHCVACSKKGEKVECHKLGGGKARGRGGGQHWPATSPAADAVPANTSEAAASTAVVPGATAGVVVRRMRTRQVAPTHVEEEPVRFHQHAEGDLRVTRMVRTMHKHSDKVTPPAKGGRPPKADSNVRVTIAMLLGTFAGARGEANDAVYRTFIAWSVKQREAHLYAKGLTLLAPDAAVAAAMSRCSKPPADTGSQPATSAPPLASMATPHTLAPDTRAAVAQRYKSVTRQVERAEASMKVAIDAIFQIETGAVSRGNRPAAASDTRDAWEATHDEWEVKLQTLLEKQRELREKLAARSPASPAELAGRFNAAAATAAPGALPATAATTAPPPQTTLPATALPATALPITNTAAGATVAAARSVAAAVGSSSAAQRAMGVVLQLQSRTKRSPRPAPNNTRRRARVEPAAEDLAG